MKWLTIPEIKRRSKTAKGALKVSYEHWSQLYDATAKELRAEYEATDGSILAAGHCGLCNYKVDVGLTCRDCIFGDYCPGGLYAHAVGRFYGWHRPRGITGLRLVNWYSWKRACKAVRDKLGELIEQGT